MPSVDSGSEEKSKKPATHAERNAADLEKMSGDFEETEDAAGMTDALKKVTEEKRSTAPVLKIKIKTEDVDLIVGSLDFRNIVLLFDCEYFSCFWLFLLTLGQWIWN